MINDIHIFVSFDREQVPAKSKGWDLPRQHLDNIKLWGWKWTDLG